MNQPRNLFAAAFLVGIVAVDFLILAVLASLKSDWSAVGIALTLGAASLGGCIALARALNRAAVADDAAYRRWLGLGP